MTPRRHTYIVPIIDRTTGAETDIIVDAASPADAISIVEAEHDAYIGTPRREDGVAEVSSSPFDRFSHIGAAPEGPPASTAPGPPHSTSLGEPIPPVQGPSFDRLIQAAERSDNRLRWLQRFAILTFWVLPAVGWAVFQLRVILVFRPRNFSWREALTSTDNIIALGSLGASLLIASILWSSVAPNRQAR